MRLTYIVWDDLWLWDCEIEWENIIKPASLIAKKMVNQYWEHFHWRRPKAKWAKWYPLFSKYFLKDNYRPSQCWLAFCYARFPGSLFWTMIIIGNNVGPSLEGAGCWLNSIEIIITLKHLRFQLVIISSGGMTERLMLGYFCHKFCTLDFLLLDLLFFYTR